MATSKIIVHRAVEAAANLSNAQFTLVKLNTAGELVQAGAGDKAFVLEDNPAAGQYGTIGLVGIGKASVDVLAKTDDAFLKSQGLAKGTMALIDASRAEALSRFMAAYARLARLPAPRRAPMDVAGWVERCAALERRVPVRVAAGPSACVEADADQLDQALINVVTNAADAGPSWLSR